MRVMQVSTGAILRQGTQQELHKKLVPLVEAHMKEAAEKNRHDSQLRKVVRRQGGGTQVRNKTLRGLELQLRSFRPNEA